MKRGADRQEVLAGRRPVHFKNCEIGKRRIGATFGVEGFENG